MTLVEVCLSTFGSRNCCNLFQMEHHKKLLNSILSNKLDRVNVVSSLIKFGIPFQEDAQYVVLKLKLKYSLLSNMITYLKSTDCQEEVFSMNE